MPPKKKNTKKSKSSGGELNADEMRRMGMNEEDIERILNERGKSDEEKKAEQVKAEEQRRQHEQRQKLFKEIARELEVLIELESKTRVEVITEEDAEWTTNEPGWSTESAKALRSFREKEAVRKADEARRKREAEVAAYQVALSQMSEEEKKALSALHAEEREEMLNKIAAKEARRARRERREARRLAQRQAALLATGDNDTEVNSNELENTTHVNGISSNAHDIILSDNENNDDDDDDDDDEEDDMDGKKRRVKKGAVVQREMNKLTEEDYADMTDELLAKVYE